MPKKALGTLTESMFYVLLSLRGTPSGVMPALYGTEIAARIAAIGGGTVEIGPATLYTVLGKFRDAGYIEEVDDPSAVGRMRLYRLTDAGAAACEREYDRLRRCIADADAVFSSDMRYTDEDKCKAAQNPDSSLQTV